MTEPRVTAGGVGRVLLLAVPLAAVGSAMASYSDLYPFKKLGAYQLAPGAIALYALVLAANALVRRVSPRHALGRAELLLVFAMVSIGVLIGGAGGDSAFMPSLAYPFYFANESNRLAALVHPHTPGWLVPTGLRESARWFFEGLRPGMAVPWAAWLSPVAAWSLLLAGMYGAGVAVSLLVYDRWARQERLRFPLMEIPLAITGGQPRDASIRLKAGFLLAAGFGLLQGLPYSFPTFPIIASRWVLPAPLAAPWSAWGDTIVNLSPAVVGLSYIISSDVCFSLVGFHMLFRLMNVAALGAGLPMEMEQDYWAWKEYQALICFGGYVGFAATALWPMLSSWLGGKRRAGGALSPIEARAVRSDRRAGLLLALSLACVFLWMRTLGMSALAAGAAIAIYLVFAVVLTRVVCEIGLFLIQPPILPSDVLGGLGIARHGADAALISFVMPSVLFELRGSILPAMLQGMKLADEARAPTRRALGAMLAAIPLALAAAYVVHLLVFYRYGASQCLDVWSAKEQAGVGFDNLARRAGSVAGVQWSRVGWMAGGLSLLVGMQQLRRAVLWFPVNPVGMVMAVSYPSVTLWASMTVGGLLKVLMLRYGGKRWHDAGKDVAIGVVLGHVAFTLFWYAFDYMTGTSARPLGLE